MHNRRAMADGERPVDWATAEDLSPLPPIGRLCFAGLLNV